MTLKSNKVTQSLKLRFTMCEYVSFRIDKSL